jgi:hypothetical protein
MIQRRRIAFSPLDLTHCILPRRVNERRVRNRRKYPIYFRCFLMRFSSGSKA